MEHVSCRPNGMVEYWNVGLNREVTHLLTSSSREVLSIDHFFQELFTHYSSIPTFQHSNCERSGLSSISEEIPGYFFIDNSKTGQYGSPV
jgi:hypothetical protein